MALSVAPDSVAAVKYGVDISPAGRWGPPKQIAELAVLAEDHGWDGVFCEDYPRFPGDLPDLRRLDHPRTGCPGDHRVTIGRMVTALPARPAPTVALQARSVWTVSDGRLVLGVGSGDPNGDPVIGNACAPRAHLLDAALTEIRQMAPEVPVWVGGALTKPGPRARALLWEGACPYRVPRQSGKTVTPDDVAAGDSRRSARRLFAGSSGI